MRLAIILGFADAQHRSVPSVVYAGHDNTAAQKAMTTATEPFLLVIKNPLGLRKPNPRAQANALALAAAGPQEGAVVEVTEQELHDFKEEMKRLHQVAADRSVALDAAQARIADLEAKLAAVPPVVTQAPGESQTSSPGSSSVAVESSSEAPAPAPEPAEQPKRSRRS